MSKEGAVSGHDNSFGVVGVVLGILSIVTSLFSNPIAGILFAIIGFSFSLKQKKHAVGKWSRAGLILNVVGFVVSIIALVITAAVLNTLKNNPQLLSELQGLGAK